MKAICKNVLFRESLDSCKRSLFSESSTRPNAQSHDRVIGWLAICVDKKLRNHDERHGNSKLRLIFERHPGAELLLVSGVLQPSPAPSCTPPPASLIREVTLISEWKIPQRGQSTPANLRRSRAWRVCVGVWRGDGETASVQLQWVRLRLKWRERLRQCRWVCSSVSVWLWVCVPARCVLINSIVVDASGGRRHKMDGTR